VPVFDEHVSADWIAVASNIVAREFDPIDDRPKALSFG
jgi:hypothetical protein